MCYYVTKYFIVQYLIKQCVFDINQHHYPSHFCTCLTEILISYVASTDCYKNLYSYLALFHDKYTITLQYSVDSVGNC